MNKKIKSVTLKVLSITILTSVMSSSLVFAKTDSLLVQANGKYFKYNLKSLNDDAVNNAMGLSALLYDEYKTRILVAFHDDKVGYVDQSAVNGAAVGSVMDGTKFDLDIFTEAATGTSIIPKPNSVQNRELRNGILVDGILETGTDDNSGEIEVIDIY